MSACDPHEHCITCGDVGTRMRVLRIDDDLAVCEADDGEPRTIEIALVEDVSEGDDVLVHGDVALVRL